MKKYYNINYSLLVLLLTPTLLRNDLFRLFLLSLIRPLDDLQNDFVRFDESLQTKNNAQICYMQAVINDEFDFYERRIKIRMASIDFDYYLLWKEVQNQPIMITSENSDIYNPYLLNKDGQIGANNLDFEIVFPAGFTLSIDEQRNLRLLVNKNKLTSKKYRIVYE